ncbi:MAG TPA: ABC transporter substrate-binding protein [Gaiellaceae bacterium]
MVKIKYIGLLALVLVLALVPGAAPATAVPTRIISLSPTATEDLYAIGAGRQVIAVDNQSDYPSNAPKTKLSGYTPNAEAIAGYNPDLVVVSYDANHVVEALGKLHIPVLVEPTATTLGQAYAQIGQLGHATANVAGANRTVSSMKKQIAAIVKSVPRPKPALTVYHELEPDLYSATSKTFIGRIYSLLGLKDIADAADKTGSGYPQLSDEYIVAADPKLIVLADSICCGQTVAKVDKRPGWSTIAATKDGGVVSVSDDIASRWGPRIVNFVRIVAAAVTRVARA